MPKTDDRAAIREFCFDLPPFPAAASQLVAELNQPDVQVARIIQLIECEPIVGSQVIRLANSPIYGTSRPITTIGHAIVVLGFKSVAQLALTVATADIFQTAGSTCADARRRTYCQSLAVATLARALARIHYRANPDEAFLAGVMHDIGKVILLDAAGDLYGEMISRHAGDTTPRENETFGTTHPLLGAACGREWGLPHCIALAIKHHHTPLVEVSEPLSKTIIAANYYARLWQIGFEANDAVDLKEDDEADIPAVEDASIQPECMEQFAAIAEICLP